MGAPSGIPQFGMGMGLGSVMEIGDRDGVWRWGQGWRQGWGRSWRWGQGLEMGTGWRLEIGTGVEMGLETGDGDWRWGQDWGWKWDWV